MLALSARGYVPTRPVLPQTAIKRPDNLRFNLRSHHVGDGHIDPKEPRLANCEGANQILNLGCGEHNMTKLWAYELPVRSALDRVASIGFGVCGSNGQLSYNDRNRGEIVQFAAYQAVFSPFKIDEKENGPSFLLNLLLQLPTAVRDQELSRDEQDDGCSEPSNIGRFHVASSRP
jgi:hypothetical protein